MDLSVGTRTISDVEIIDLSGRLWILNLPLRDLVKKLLDEGRRYFVLNLTNLTYIDSSGLGQMLAIWASITNLNGHMTLLRPSDRVQSLLEITKLNSVFQIFADENKAVIASRGKNPSFGIGA
jgi:anti-sigma B factor antagonist